MEYLVDWQDDAENASPEERATVADLRLSLNGINVTQHLFETLLSDHVTVALYGMAHGIAHDWWTIFGSRDRETTLLNYRSGYVFPDIAIRFDGAAVEIEARQHNYRNPDARFWSGPSEVMSRQHGEMILTDLVEVILARLAATGFPETGAALRWRRVQASRQSAEAVFCEAAGGLGLDPYEIDEDAAAFIEDAERIFEPEPLVEFVSGANKVKRFDLLNWVKKMRGHRGSKYRLAELRPAIDETERRSPARAREDAWAVGYRRARALRKVLGLPDSARFRSFRDIAERLGAGRGYNLAPRIDGIKALRSERDDGIQIHLRSHGDSAEAQSAHLFAMARAVGDAACFPRAETAPINDLHHAVRQAAGRAFAAEFLAPINEIRCMLDDKRDLITIANEFSVSTTVVELQIQNQRRIAQACA